MKYFMKFRLKQTSVGTHTNLLIKRCGCPPLVIPVEHTSEGMIRNMVLACVVAWKLGVSDQEICERLPQYRPLVYEVHAS